MSGSMPEPLVVTAQTGIPAAVRPGLYGLSRLSTEATLAFTACARSGLVGPRFANVVAPALYGGTVADGRTWKYRVPVNSWAASFDPITFPSRVIRLPCAFELKASWANPVITAG